MTAADVWAVLPVKAWSEAKRRLSPVLSGEERQKLARAMLDDVLEALRGASRIAGVLAVTTDAVAAEYLKTSGCDVLPEPRRGLNRALGTAASELDRRGASTMLVLPIDLPLVDACDLDELCSRHLDSVRRGDGGSSPQAAVTVAPDRFRSGTNALLCSPPGRIPFRFGDGSFQAHLREAERLRIPASSVEIDGLSLDIDHPDDLSELLRRSDSSGSASFLRELGVAGRLAAR